jgi:YD repeat-containing protein
MRALSILFLVVIPAVAHGQPLLPFKSRELQEGRHYIQKHVAVPEVSEPSGQLNETYPIELPSIRGPKPPIVFEYSSSGGGSEYGWGWELSLPAIERSRRQGVPSSSRDLYRFRQGHSSAEIIPTGVTTALGGVEYRERIERSFNRYVRYGNRWVILTAKGLRYELGDIVFARAGTDTSSITGTFAWFATKVSDPNSNYVTYEYEFDSISNPRIRAIRAGGNSLAGIQPPLVVDFLWVPRGGSPFVVQENYASGYRRRFGRDVLDQVRVNAPKHATSGPSVVPVSSPEVRTYQLVYESPEVVRNKMFYLASIAVVGLPPVYYTYNNPWSSPDGTLAVDVGVAVFASAPTPPAFPGHLGRYENETDSSVRTRSSLASLYGTTRLSLVDAEPNQGTCGNWNVWTLGTSDDPQNMIYQQTWPKPFDLLGHLPDACALRVAVQIGDRNITTQDYVDMNGDSRPDIVYVAPPGSGVGGLVKVCLSLPADEVHDTVGFADCTFFNGGVTTEGLRIVDSFDDLQLTTTDLVDMNSDGLVDLVKASNFSLSIHFNTGTGFLPTAITSQLPACPGLPGVLTCLRATRSAVFPDGNRQLLAEIRDINGDGIPDYLASQITTTALSVAYGTGTGFGPLTSLGINQVIGLSQQSGGTSTTKLDLVDFNGDHLPDFVNIDCSSTTYTVRYNNGGYWDSLPHTYRLSGGGSEYVRPCLSRSTGNSSGGRVESVLVDITRDGLPDFVTAPLDGSLFTNHLAIRPLHTRVSQRALIGLASNNSNHLVDVGYTPVIWANAPYAVNAVEVVTKTRTPLWSGEPTRHTRATTYYSYGEGVYSFPERSFLGFVAVTRIGPYWESFMENDVHGSVVISTYGTSLADQGVLKSRQSTNTGCCGGILEYEQYVYTTISLGGSRTWLRLDQAEKRPAMTRSQITDYQAYDAFGTATQWTERKVVGASGQDIVNETSFVIRSDEDFVLHLPAIEKRGFGDASNGSETRYYYDNRTTLGATPSQGNLVKTERKRTAASFVSRQAFFDTVGNIGSETDETGYSTTHTYDTTYRSFRISTINSIGATFRSYHALTGAVADECGPQYSGNSYNCSRTEIDVVGRIVRVWSSDMANGLFSLVKRKSVAYGDLTYPTSTIVTNSSGSRVVEYSDGFGNAVEIREEETGGASRVFETSFDATGRPLRRELPRRESGVAYSHLGSATSEAWRYEHDTVHGAMTKIIQPRLSTEPCQMPPCEVSAMRSIQSDKTVLTDEDGRVVQYVYDGNNRVERIVELGSTQSSTTTFAYDHAGNITQFSDPSGMATNYQRNLAGWIIGVTPPGSTPFTYAHNDRGQVASAQDPRGVTVSWTYDSAGRVASIVGSGSGARAVNASFTYFGADVDTTQIARLRTESSDGITHSYSYEPRGMVKSHAVQYLSSGGMVQFAYDSDARLSRVTYPSPTPASVDYTYDIGGQLSKVKVLNGATLGEFLYEDDGQVSAVSNPFGLEESYQYDIRGRLVSLVSTNTAITTGDLVDDRITLTDAGSVRVVKRYGLRPGLVPRSTPDVFDLSMDYRERVTSIAKNGSAYASYTYDSSSKFNSYRDGTTASQSAFYEFDRLSNIGDQEWTYDAAGNASYVFQPFPGPTFRYRTLEWDALSRFAAFSSGNGSDSTGVLSPPSRSTTYYYTPRGAVSRVTNPGDLPNSADNIYVGDFARLDRTSNKWVFSVRAHGVTIAEIDGARFNMPHRTILQTVAAVSNDVGQVVRQSEFSPFGRLESGTSTGGLEEFFHGLRADEIVTAGTRAYDPGAGVWLTRDKLVLQNPESVLSEPRNAYMYGFNFGNPYRYRDPAGTHPEGLVSDMNGSAVSAGVLTYKGGSSIGRFLSEEVGPRLMGVVEVIGAAGAVVGSIALCSTGVGCAILVAGVTLLASDAAGSGATKAVTGRAGQRVVDKGGTVVRDLADAALFTAGVAAMGVGGKAGGGGVPPIGGGQGGAGGGSKGIPFPKGTKPGQMVRNVDPVSLTAGRRDLVLSKLSGQRDLVRNGITRHHPIQVTSDGIIYEGNHGVRAAAEKGVSVDVEVVDMPVTAHGDIRDLPIATDR